MKRLVAIILALIVCLSLCACGKNAKVISVEQLISEIGVVTLESENAIIAAETAYNSLSEKHKVNVENYSVLSEAREQVDLLIAENEKQKLIAKAEELLQGTWTRPFGDAGLATSEYTFKDGKLSCTTIALGITLEPQKGKYIIDESVIKIIWSSENEYEINYTIENDTLILIDPDQGPIFERVEVKPASEITEEDIEYAAMEGVYSYLSRVYSDFYDIPASRYKVGKISSNGKSGYTVKGTLSLYNDYGKFEDDATFEVNVVFDSIGRLKAETPKIKINY